MIAPAFRSVLLTVVALTALASIPFAWYQIDRGPSLVYQGGWYEALPSEGAKVGERITSAKPGQTVVLALHIKWPRTNCSTELQRTFIGSDGVVYKVGEAVRLGPPPVSILDADMTNISRRQVVIPKELPNGTATHSPNAWIRCTSPAQKIGDHLSEVWPIFIGPKGADIPIRIDR